MAAPVYLDSKLLESRPGSKIPLGQQVNDGRELESGPLPLWSTPQELDGDVHALEVGAKIRFR